MYYLNIQNLIELFHTRMTNKEIKTKDFEREFDILIRKIKEKEDKLEGSNENVYYIYIFRLILLKVILELDLKFLENQMKEIKNMKKKNQNQKI